MVSDDARRIPLNATRQVGEAVLINTQFHVPDW
jgi:hypothetical protein